MPAGAKGWLSDRHYAANQLVAAGKRDGELAFVRLRYKLPDGDTSRLIERPVDSRLLDQAAPPRGDMAFVTAVAAFGQKLRGDTRLGELNYADIRRLAGHPDGYWRQEFVKLTELAEAGSPSRTARMEGIE